MKISDALEHFRLKTTDKITKQGLLDIIKINDDLMRQTLSNQEREKCKKEIEAAQTILDFWERKQ